MLKWNGIVFILNGIVLKFVVKKTLKKYSTVFIHIVMSKYMLSNWLIFVFSTNGVHIHL